MVTVRLRDGPAEVRRQAGKSDYPEGGRDAEAQGDDRRRSKDGDEQTPAPPWVESDPRPHRASLTTWDDESDGERDRDHRHRNTDQRCNSRVR